MRTINITAIIILAFALLSNEKEQVQSASVCIPDIKPQTKVEEEAAVAQIQPTAETFSRPRRPCPPSGPGRK